MKVTTDSCLFGAWAASRISNLDATQNVLDIGSGSGLLCLMMAQQTRAFIDGVELQFPDYRQSMENLAASPFAANVRLYQGDARQFNYQKQYDAIVSNPPFYENDLKGSAAGKNIAHHDEGLKLPELLRLIATHLSSNGNFYLLLPSKRWEPLQQLAAAAGLHINEVVRVRSTEKHEAFRILVGGSFLQTGVLNSDMVIKEKDHYSTAFTHLLQPYYLNL